MFGKDHLIISLSTSATDRNKEDVWKGLLIISLSTSATDRNKKVVYICFYSYLCILRLYTGCLKKTEI